MSRLGVDVTSRKIVEQLREAFCAGVAWGTTEAGARERSYAAAMEFYEMPKVTRQRTLTDEMGCQWTASDVHQLRTALVTPERVKIWADLLANPTEEVVYNESLTDGIKEYLRNNPIRVPADALP